MVTPASAKEFPEALDPYELLEFEPTITGATGLLEDGESISSFTLTAGAEAAALGISISTEAGYVASTIDAARGVRFWMEVAGGFQQNAAFDGEGVAVPIVLSLTTNNSPARRRQRTMIVRVKQQ